jgi:hypothetical protein
MPDNSEMQVSGQEHKKRGCGYCGGFFAGGCGCLLVTVILAAVIVFSVSAWTMSRIYEGNTPEVAALSKSICTHTVPKGFTLVGGVDLLFARGVLYNSRNKKQPAMLVLMDTPMEGMNASLMNQVFELLATRYLLKQGRIQRVTMSDKQTFQLYGTNTIDRFTNTVYLKEEDVQMTWHQGIFIQGDRTVYICFVELGTDAIRANAFFDSIGPPK